MDFSKKYSKEHYAIEMKFAGIRCSWEHEMPIYYRSINIGTRRVDFLVEENISVELKAMVKPDDVHLSQAINYLESYNIEDQLWRN